MAIALTRFNPAVTNAAVDVEVENAWEHGLVRSVPLTNHDESRQARTAIQ